MNPLREMHIYMFPYGDGDVHILQFCFRVSMLSMARRLYLCSMSGCIICEITMRN